MKGFDTLKIKSAVRSRSKQLQEFSHLTTMQIGEIVPLCVFDVVPGDEIKVDTNLFSRLAPLVKPTYGKFQFKTVSAYVPFHMIAADAEAWLAGKTAWEGYTPNHRYFTVLSVVTLFASLSNALATETGATQSNCDFTWVDTSGTRHYDLFTKKGKYYYKILCSLGYTFPSGADLQTASSWYQNVATKKLSAYPLLAFLKLYNDYMSQSQRFNTSSLSNYLNGIKYGKAISGIWLNSTGEILSPGILAMLNSVLVNYENDYFTSAWQSANNPLAGSDNVSSMTVPADGNVISDTLADNVASISTALPQRVIDFLRSFDNWVRRNHYSGSRDVQQIYSRFGIKVSDYREHFANVLSVNSHPIQVGDVTAMADASGVPLGDYAGKGILSGTESVSLKVDDFGIFFILGFITVSPMNPYGYNRRVLRVDPLEYYNPEFDGLGADAISVGEFYADPLDETGAVLDTSVFGYTERYNSYRFCRDVITGEMRNFHPNGDMNCWHTGRNLNSVRAAGFLLAQNSAVNTMPQTDSEYNRIFSNTSGDVDHFYMTAQFKIDAIRPMMNLNQVVNLGEGNTVIPRNGNTIS